MLTRTVKMIAGVVCAMTSFAAHAQTPYFGVQATAQTLGYTGTFTNDTGWLPGSAFASALSDPAGVTLTSPYEGSAFADVGSGSQAERGQLHAWATAHTHSVTAKSFNGAAPYGYAYAYGYDTLTVKSDTLAKGTRVTLVFDNVVTLNSWTYTGLFDGYVDMRLQIGAVAAGSRWSMSHRYGGQSVQAPQVTVQTTVGSRLSVDGKLRVQTKTPYYDPPYGFGGDMRADATATLVLHQATEGVTLQADSGAVYAVAMPTE
jgi:hypothetical protein